MIEKRLIDVDSLINELEFLARHEDPWRQSAILGIAAYIRGLPIVEDVSVRHELMEAVSLLEKNYERGLVSDYVNNPVAWALHQTWKQVDEGTDNG